MPKVKRYRHGTPCWIDLATTDLAGAKAFYAGLFGWEYVDEQMGEMDIGVYSMAMLDGSAAAAIYESGPGQIRSDGAAKWNVYVSVDEHRRRRRAGGSEWWGCAGGFKRR